MGIFRETAEMNPSVATQKAYMGPSPIYTQNERGTMAQERTKGHKNVYLGAPQVFLVASQFF